MSEGKKRGFNRRSAGQGGAAVVEFALTVPIFFLIIFGLIQFSIIFAGYCGAAYASQVGVRYAIVHGVNSSSPVSADSTAMKALMTPLLWAAQSGGTTIGINWNPDDSIGSTVTVSVTLVYKTGIPFSKLNTVNLGAAAKGTILF